MLSKMHKRMNVPSEWLDQWLFFIVFVTGALAIIVLKWLRLPQWAVTTTPLLIMGGYAAHLFFSPRFRLREDRAGDNLYYLGFLYTLTSLAYSLHLFVQDGNETQAIVSNFGIALGTTIVGLALRVLFNQMREDLEGIEQEARLELSKAVTSLKTELNEAVIDFNSFRRSTIQSTKEGVEEVGEKTIAALTHSLTQYTEVAKKTIEKIDEAFVNFSDHSRKLNDASEGIVNKIEKLFQRVDQIQVPTDLIEKKIVPVIEKLTANVEQFILKTKAETDQITELQKLIQGTAGASQTIQQNLMLCAQLLSTFRTSTEGQIEILKKLTDGAQGDLAVVRTHRQALETELNTSRNLVGEVHTSLLSLTSLVMEKLNGH